MKLVPRNVYLELLDFMYSGCPYEFLYKKDYIKSLAKAGKMVNTWEFINEDQHQCNYFMLNLRKFFGGKY
jgi:hypothetical protein